MNSRLVHIVVCGERIRRRVRLLVISFLSRFLFGCLFPGSFLFSSFFLRGFLLFGRLLFLLCRDALLSGFDGNQVKRPLERDGTASANVLKYF